jgi:hypothetical protein
MRGLVRRCVLAAVAVVCAATLHGVRGDANAAALNDQFDDAPFADGIGLKCHVQSDCGFLPGLACIEGYAL